ncbi:MAG: outer membrane lipoprotein carrier protein LolA [Alphaproteobacteria bacterium]|nr:outer membrane lipoprotein carrier protein LolA [Alphaproteobacteria bacterium]
MNFRRRFLALLAMLALAAPAHAGKPSTSLETVESYLNNLTTLVADFVQVSPSGALASGKFFLSRPAKLRWQYDPPTPILIVASGNLLSYYDIELQQTSNIPLGATLADFLVRPKIRFADDIKVLEFNEEANAIRLVVTQSEKPDEGKLALIFEARPLQIRKLEIVDSTGKTTFVSFNNLRYGDKLPDSLFVLPMKEKFGRPQP